MTASFPSNWVLFYNHDCPAFAGRFLFPCPCFDRGPESSGQLCQTSTGPALNAVCAPGRPSHVNPRNDDGLVRDCDGDEQEIRSSSCPAGADEGTTLVAVVRSLYLGENEVILRCSCPSLDAASVAGRADGTSAGLCLASHRVGHICRAKSDRRLHACHRWSVRVVEQGSLVWEEDSA